MQNARSEFYGSMRLRYGNPFDNYRKPFDNFFISVEVGGADSAFLNSIWVQGSLWGKVTGGGDRSLHMLRLTMNYDFYKNTAFEYGGQSLLLTWAGYYPIGKNWKIACEAGGGAMILSASPDHHHDYHDARNYTYGSGVGLLALAEISYKDRLFYRLNYRANWTATINGSSSNNALHLTASELRYRFYKNFTLTGSWGNFRLLSFYPGFEDSDELFPFLRASLGYKVRL